MLNKIVYNVMLISILHSSFVAPAQDLVYAYFNQQEGLRYKGFRSTEENVLPVAVPTATEAQHQIVQKQSSYPSSYGSAPKELAMTSDILHGYIGVTPDQPLDDVSDNIFKVAIEDLPQDATRAFLSYELYGLQDYHGATRSINDRLAIGGHVIKKSSGWSMQREEIDIAWLQQGENRIMFGIPQGANLQYQVRHLRIEFEGNENGSILPLLSTANPIVHSIKDNRLYVRGFVRNQGSNETHVSIEGVSLAVNEGEFEGFLELTQELKKRGFAVIKANSSDGLLGQEIIDFTHHIEADHLFPLEVAPEKKIVQVEAAKGGAIKMEGASMIISEDALADSKEISITHLRRKDVAPMASGMINVTKGGSAYRFLPDGTKFNKMVSLSIGYDEKLIPNGYTARDIKTFYFSTRYKTWIPVAQDTIKESERMVVALTDHFTDYINGIIQTPESPETAGFTPTMMNDIKAADPSSEMILISPPNASQKGDANISYPIKIPSGRNGMQPQIELQYNSDAGSGWLGLGWNINIPAISIDTRWGTPEINNTHETVIYTLAGEQLMYPKFINADNVAVDWMPNRHYDSTATVTSTQARLKIVGTPSTVFSPRKQGSFAKIERMGSTPSTYYWKVTNTDGTISWYGGKTGIVENAVLKNAQGNIVYWSLFMVEDVHLNNIKYTYKRESIGANQTANERIALSSGLIYNIEKIHYTGNKGSTGIYEVEFKRSLFTSVIRKDVTIDARLGLKLVDPCRLNEILIRRTGSGTLIRRYVFSYAEGEFQKTLLKYVAEYDRLGTEFYRHTFGYYNDVKSGSEVTLFARPYEVKIPDIDPSFTLGIDNLLKVSALGSSQSIEAGWGLNVSGGLQFRLWKYNDDPYGSLTLNFPLGESYPKDRGYVTMSDIDGDGIDDLIYKKSNGLRYIPGQINLETGKFEFTGLEKSIAGITNFSTSTGKTKTMFLESFNLKAKIPGVKKEFFGGRSRTKSEIKSDIFFTDGNSDGLLDIVKDNVVLFNQPDAVTGGRKFTSSSQGTPNMLITASGNEVPDVNIIEKGEFDGAQDYDAVRVWIAPKAGLIRIDDKPYLTGLYSNSKTYYSIETAKASINNGIPFRLYLTQLTDVSTPIVAITNYAGNSPNLGSLNKSPLMVDKGQKFFFRVTKNGIENNDEVNTNPTIKYLNETDAELLKDENGVDHMTSSFKDGFILSEEQYFEITSSGSLSISWDDIEINQVSDSVTYNIIMESESGTQLLYSSSVYNGMSGYITIGSNQHPSGSNFYNPMHISISRKEVKRIRFEVVSQSNVKWKDIQWKPKLIFTPDANSVEEGMSSLPVVKYPIAKYSIHKTNLQRRLAPVLGWSPPSTVSYYGIKPNPVDVFDEGDNGIFTMIVKIDGMLYDQRTFEVNEGVVTLSSNDPIIFSTPINIHNTASQFHYSVGYYMETSRDEALFNKYALATNFKTALLGHNLNLPPTNPAVLSFFVESQFNNLEYLGPMHREWGQFFYNDGLDTSITIPSDQIGKLINPSIGNRYDALYNQFAQIDENNPCFGLSTDEQIQDCLEKQYIEDANIPAEGTVTPENIDELNLDVLLNLNTQEAVITPLLPSRASRTYPEQRNQVVEMEKWIGLFDTQYVRETKVRTGSFSGSSFDQIFPDELDNGGIVQADKKTGMHALTKNRISVSVSNTAGWGPVNLTKGKSGYSYGTSDFIDMNGDGYPDLMSSERLQLSGMTGGHRPWIPHTFGHVSSSQSDATRLTLQGGSQDLGRKGGPKPSPNFASTVDRNGPNAVFLMELATLMDIMVEEQNAKDQGNPAFTMGLGADVNLSGENKEKVMWTDINGDGLPDKLYDEGNGFKFNLNTGKGVLDSPQLKYNFLANSDVSLSANKPIALGLSLNFGLNVNSLFAGTNLPVDINLSAGIGNSGSTGKSALVDFNGDGLPDLLDVNEGAGSLYLNNGNGFSSTALPLMINGSNVLSMESESKTTSMSVAGDVSIYKGWTICCAFFFFYLPLLHIKAGVTANGNASLSLSNSQKAFKDFNGDGYVDFVERDGDKLKVYESKIARTNKLMTVTNPLKGTFTIDYKVEKINYDNPRPKWVMSEVKINDGYNKGNDGEDEYVKRFVYEKGRYDRRERTFYGYETIRETDGLNLKTSVAKYHNESYFLNGLLKEAYVIKGSNEQQKYSRTENFYEIRKLDANNLMTNTVLSQNFDTGGSEGRHSVAVVLAKTKSYLYELSSSPLTTEVNFTYDHYGRVISCQNLGNVALAGDNYTSTIAYGHSALESKHILNVPSSISVAAPTEMRKRTTSVDGNGNLLTINSYLTNTAFVTTSMKYDAYGNRIEITYPPNSNPVPQSMFYKYTYDTTNSYKVEKTEDAFGYVSSISYHDPLDPTNNFYYDSDKIITATAISGNMMKYTYDTFGRLKTITSPKEMQGNIPTISFDYYLKRTALPSGSGISTDADFMPVAVSSHYDFSNPTNFIETFTFIDGLARPVQVKKDITLNRGTAQNPNYIESLSVSGWTSYDKAAQPVKEYLPGSEAKSNAVKFKLNTATTAIAETIEYDAIGRVKRIEDADGNPTEIAYSIAEDNFGMVAQKTSTVVAQNLNNNMTSAVYKDVAGRVVSTHNSGLNAELWTQFKYNAIGELTSSMDAANLTTVYRYDRLGRKVSVDHPDNGFIRYEYDKASNLVGLQTKNLYSDNSIPVDNRYIRYQYSYNRLDQITYPNTPNGVNISNVRYNYGPQSLQGAAANNRGKLIRQDDATGIQTFDYGNMGEMISSSRTVVAPNIPTRVFITRFEYDSWNRLKTMTYPDQEQLRYTYDHGGNLNGILSSTYPAYIRQIDYDHFEQRTYLLYGNFTETTYSYTPTLRRLNRLNVKTSNQQDLFNNTYTYDMVGNVTSIVNGAGSINNSMGGTYNHSFKYDRFNRLTEAQGTFNGSNAQANNGNDFQSAYTTLLDYNSTHGIASKKQTHTKNFATNPINTYEHAYKYHDGTHRLSQLQGQGGNVLQVNHYDHNGNMKVKANNTAESLYYWDESNRLRVVRLSGGAGMQHYLYDAGGERILKANSNSTHIFENGSMSNPPSVTFNSYTTYPSAFMVIDPNGIYSNHYYAGSQRIVSRLGDQNADIFNQARNKSAGAGESAPEDEFDEEALKQLQVADLQQYVNEDEGGTVSFMEYAGSTYQEENLSLQEEEDEEASAGLLADSSMITATSTSGAIYFYHPDHLGSSTFLTDVNGNRYQFFLNLPFGETMAEQYHGSYYKTPFKFSGKEMDAETGLHYFGARYYDSRTSIWLSVDPLAEVQPDKTPYHYASNNPINRIDPDGMWDIEVHTYKDRSKSGYGVMIMRDNSGNEIYRTIVKTVGYGGRKRDVSMSDTPQGNYKILGWRKTGKRYNTVTYGPNDLLALNYKNGEGGSRNGMHIHGGRQEGKYKKRKHLMETGGCFRINDDDIKAMKEIVMTLEKNNSSEKPGVLTMVDDLITPVNYDQDRHNAGASQFPTNSQSSGNETKSMTLQEEYEWINSVNAYDPNYVKKRSSEIMKEISKKSN